jgi:hypothetical protein
MDNLRVRGLLSLYMLLRPDALLLVKRQGQPVASPDEPVRTAGELQHPGRDAPINLFHLVPHHFFHHIHDDACWRCVDHP